MNKDVKAKIENYIESRMENLSVELTDENVQLHFNANEAQESLENTLSEEQKKLFIDYDLKNNLLNSTEFELYYRLGFYDAVKFFEK